MVTTSVDSVCSCRTAAEPSPVALTRCAEEDEEEEADCEDCEEAPRRMAEDDSGEPPKPASKRNAVADGSASGRCT